MSETVENNPVRKKRSSLLLLFAVLLSPLACCGTTYVLDVLPSSIVPPIAGFMLNMFEAEARVENRTAETLYITAVTTTTGEPIVIPQSSALKQRDLAVKPGQSKVLAYDTADRPLTGIAVCRTSEDCRLLAADYTDAYYLEAYEELPRLDQAWLTAIHSSPKWRMEVVIFPVLGLLPIVLFISWLYLIGKERKSKNENGVKTAL